jgi:hypothetical protein
LTRRGAWAWFHDVWTCSAKLIEYLMISSLKFLEELECAFGVLDMILMSRIYEIYLVRFGFRMWEILIFK